MKTALKLFLFFLFISDVNCAGAQFLARLDKEIFSHTRDFDSVILIYDHGTFGYFENQAIKGYGVKGKEVFRLSLVFNDKKGFFDGDKKLTKAIFKTIIKNQSIKDSIKAINFSSITFLNSDSLNLMQESKNKNSKNDRQYITISDGELYIIWTGNKKTFFKAEAYEPYSYQNQYPTKDRETFIAIYREVDQLYHP